jgi:hypothetical protein
MEAMPSTATQSPCAKTSGVCDNPGSVGPAGGSGNSKLPNGGHATTREGDANVRHHGIGTMQGLCAPDSPHKQERGGDNPRNAGVAGGKEHGKVPNAAKTTR